MFCVALAIPAGLLLLTVVAASGGAYSFLAAGVAATLASAIALTRNLGVLLRAAVSRQKPPRFALLVIVTAVCGYVVAVFLYDPVMIFVFPFNLARWAWMS